MQVSKWICFAASWIFVVAQDIYDDNPNPDTQNYQFRYYVRDESTGDIKSQEETKQGGTVSGHYSIGEPTGDLRVVTYTADEGGFRADVKYEEGGSPASEDKARQTNSKSGVEFHWLPANPDDIQEGKTGTEENTTGSSSEGNQVGTESTTTNMSELAESSSEATTESTSTTETNSEPSTTTGSNNDSEKESKENDSSSEVFSTESSSESSNTISETPLSSSESTISSTESVATSLETSTSSIEGKDTTQPDEENKPSTEDEDSAEAAESAPLSEEVLPPLQPSQMYLPVISYQNLPFLNIPMFENAQVYSERPPAIIYASQNFYNPTQYFENRRIARDVRQHIHQHIQTSAKGFQYPVVPKQ